jgi:hypothetical protein
MMMMMMMIIIIGSGYLNQYSDKATGFISSRGNKGISFSFHHCICTGFGAYPSS